MQFLTINPDKMQQQNRRHFLKTGAALGGSLLASSAFSFVAASEKGKSDKKTPTTKIKQRTLGTGQHSIEVSALGLGCMGMSYHRSFIPDKKVSVALIRKAYDMGVTFFDTAEAYGPLTNEALVGEALVPFRKEIILATKFGFKEGKPSLGLDSRPERIRKVVEHSLKALKRIISTCCINTVWTLTYPWKMWPVP